MFNVESLFDDSEADHLFSVIQNGTSVKYFLNPLKNKSFVIVSFDKWFVDCTSKFNDHCSGDACFPSFQSFP